MTGRTVSNANQDAIRRALEEQERRARQEEERRRILADAEGLHVSHDDNETFDAGVDARIAEAEVQDRDGDGVQDRALYIDANHDGALNAGEEIVGFDFSHDGFGGPQVTQNEQYGVVVGGAPDLATQNALVAPNAGVAEAASDAGVVILSTLPQPVNGAASSVASSVVVNGPPPAWTADGATPPPNAQGMLQLAERVPGGSWVMTVNTWGEGTFSYELPSEQQQAAYASGVPYGVRSNGNLYRETAWSEDAQDGSLVDVQAGGASSGAIESEALRVQAVQTDVEAQYAAVEGAERVGEWSLQPDGSATAVFQVPNEHGQQQDRVTVNPDGSVQTSASVTFDAPAGDLAAWEANVAAEVAEGRTVIVSGSGGRLVGINGAEPAEGGGFNFTGLYVAPDSRATFAPGELGAFAASVDDAAALSNAEQGLALTLQTPPWDEILPPLDALNVTPLPSTDGFVQPFPPHAVTTHEGEAVGTLTADAAGVYTFSPAPGSRYEFAANAPPPEAQETPAAIPLETPVPVAEVTEPEAAVIEVPEGVAAAAVQFGGGLSDAPPLVDGLMPGISAAYPTQNGGVVVVPSNGVVLADGTVPQSPAVYMPQSAYQQLAEHGGVVGSVQLAADGSWSALTGDDGQLTYQPASGATYQSAQQLREEAATDRQGAAVTWLANATRDGVLPEGTAVEVGAEPLAQPPVGVSRTAPVVVDVEGTLRVVTTQSEARTLFNQGVEVYPVEVTLPPEVAVTPDEALATWREAQGGAVTDTQVLAAPLPPESVRVDPENPVVFVPSNGGDAEVLTSEAQVQARQGQGSFYDVLVTRSQAALGQSAQGAVDQWRQAPENENVQAAVVGEEALTQAPQTASPDAPVVAIDTDGRATVLDSDAALAATRSESGYTYFLVDVQRTEAPVARTFITPQQALDVWVRVQDEDVVSATVNPTPLAVTPSAVPEDGPLVAVPREGGNAQLVRTDAQLQQLLGQDVAYDFYATTVVRPEVAEVATPEEVVASWVDGQPEGTVATASDTALASAPARASATQPFLALPPDGGEAVVVDSASSLSALRAQEGYSFYPITVQRADGTGNGDAAQALDRTWDANPGSWAYGGGLVTAPPVELSTGVFRQDVRDPRGELVAYQTYEAVSGQVTVHRLQPAAEVTVLAGEAIEQPDPVHVTNQNAVDAWAAEHPGVASATVGLEPLQTAPAGVGPLAPVVVLRPDGTTEVVENLAEMDDLDGATFFPVTVTVAQPSDADREAVLARDWTSAQLGVAARVADEPLDGSELPEVSPGAPLVAVENGVVSVVTSTEQAQRLATTAGVTLYPVEVSRAPAVTARLQEQLESEWVSAQEPGTRAVAHAASLDAVPEDVSAEAPLLAYDRRSNPPAVSVVTTVEAAQAAFDSPGVTLHTVDVTPAPDVAVAQAQAEAVATAWAEEQDPPVDVAVGGGPLRESPVSEGYVANGEALVPGLVGVSASQPVVVYQDGVARVVTDPEEAQALFLENAVLFRAEVTPRPVEDPGPTPEETQAAAAAALDEETSNPRWYGVLPPRDALSLSVSDGNASEAFPNYDITDDAGDLVGLMTADNDGTYHFVPARGSRYAAMDAVMREPGLPPDATVSAEPIPGDDGTGQMYVVYDGGQIIGRMRVDGEGGLTYVAGAGALSQVVTDESAPVGALQDRTAQYAAEHPDYSPVGQAALIGTYYVQRYWDPDTATFLERRFSVSGDNPDQTVLNPTGLSVHGVLPDEVPEAWVGQTLSARDAERPDQRLNVQFLSASEVVVSLGGVPAQMSYEEFFRQYGRYEFQNPTELNTQTAAATVGEAALAGATPTATDALTTIDALAGEGSGAWTALDGEWVGRSVVIGDRTVFYQVDLATGMTAAYEDNTVVPLTEALRPFPSQPAARARAEALLATSGPDGATLPFAPQATANGWQYDVYLPGGVAGTLTVAPDGTAEYLAAAPVAVDEYGEVLAPPYLASQMLAEPVPADAAYDTGWSVDIYDPNLAVRNYQVGDFLYEVQYDLTTGERTVQTGRYSGGDGYSLGDGEAWPDPSSHPGFPFPVAEGLPPFEPPLAADTRWRGEWYLETREGVQYAVREYDFESSGQRGRVLVPYGADAADALLYESEFYGWRPAAADSAFVRTHQAWPGTEWVPVAQAGRDEIDRLEALGVEWNGAWQVVDNDANIAREYRTGDGSFRVVIDRLTGAATQYQWVDGAWRALA